MIVENGLVRFYGPYTDIAENEDLIKYVQTDTLTNKEKGNYN